MEFQFKYVDREQLMTVARKVRREMILRKENDNLVSFLSRNKGVCLQCKSAQIEGEERVIVNNAQDADERVENYNLGCSSDKTRISFGPTSSRTKHERNKEYYGRLNVLARRLKDLRMSILMSLDELLILSDAVVWQDDISNDSLGESEKKLNETKMRNCLCQIIKLEYPFVISLRKLHVDGHDVFSHLRVLLESHKIAFSMLKVFIRASPPSILRNEKIKEKMNGLVERIIALSSVCKFIAVRHEDFIKPRDFLLDDLDKRCLNLLVREKKVQPVEISKSKYTANSERHYTGNKNTADHKNVGKMNVDMKKFKRLAEQRFGSNRSSSRTTLKETRSKEFFLPKSPPEAESKDTVGGALDPRGKILCKNSHHPLKRSDEEVKSSSQPPDGIEEVQTENVKLDSSKNKEDTTNDPVETTGDPKEGTGEDAITETHEDDCSNTNNVNVQHEITLTKEKVISERETEHTDRVENNCDTDDLIVNRHPITPPLAEEEENYEYAHISHKFCHAIDRISEDLIGECLKEVCNEADTIVNTLVDQLVIMELT